MEFKRVLSYFFVFLMAFLSSSEAHKFFVGGKDGWVLTPSENYNHWAERMRFQVNDTLYFKYNNESDSVLIVSKDDYFSCNTKNPVKSLTDGNSIFIFDDSGPYFFISGNADNCNKGQKLIVVVMAARNKTYHHHNPPSPSPGSSPTAVSPTPASPSPSLESPKSSAPVQPPGSSDTPSHFDAPSPAPPNSGSSGLGFSVGSVLGYSVGVSLFFGSFLGMI